MDDQFVKTIMLQSRCSCQLRGSSGLTPKMLLFIYTQKHVNTGPMFVKHPPVLQSYIKQQINMLRRYYACVIVCVRERNNVENMKTRQKGNRINKAARCQLSIHRS